MPGRQAATSDSTHAPGPPFGSGQAEAGLLQASFVPPKPTRDLRQLTRYRKAQIGERQREANRLHKTLEDTGIKLDCVATDILGVSGRAMLDALVAGTTDPQLLAEPARGKPRKKLPALREALEAASTRCTHCWSARSSPTSTSSTNRSSGSPTRSRSSSALSRRRLSCCARSPVSSDAPPR
jgi:transposase